MSRRRLLILFFAVLGLAGLIIFAPDYLLYSSPYEKADAIVVLLGPDFKARQKEAHGLVREGMADYLIIPAYNKTYRVFDRRAIQYLSANFSERKAMKKNITDRPFFFEDTHLEILEALKEMSHHGLKSAIFVSSPYHMRRIKIIVFKVFNAKDGAFYFVPTHYEHAPSAFWELSWANWRKVGREYGKILWFYIYFPWTK